MGLTDSTADFEAFFRTAFPKTVAVARRVTGDRAAAEDAALEAMAQAHLKWKRIGAQPWREAYVLRVAVNQALRRSRTAASPAQATASLDHADQVVVHQTLRVALLALPRRQREVIVLRHLVGLPETEVATLLGISHGSVKTHLRRGFSGLRKSVGPDVKEEQVAQLA